MAWNQMNISKSTTNPFRLWSKRLSRNRATWKMQSRRCKSICQLFPLSQRSKKRRKKYPGGRGPLFLLSESFKSVWERLLFLPPRGPLLGSASLWSKPAWMTVLMPYANLNFLLTWNNIMVKGQCNTVWQLLLQALKH